jgi:hypothetical protein
MEPQIQENNSQIERIKPWQFKPGQSGNPGGKPKGTVSLKTYAKKYIQELSDDEKLEFLKGIDKDKVWEMAEGKAKQDMDLKGTLTISQVLDNLQNGQTPTE